MINSFEGEPYLEVYASKNDLEGFSDGELSAEEFLDRLEINNVRPLDSSAYGLLSPLGLELDRIQVDGTTLVVSYWPAPAQDQAALMEEWWSIFDALAAVEDKVEVIEVQSLMLDGSMISVSEEVARLKDYRIGEVTALEFLAGLEVVVEEFVE